MLTLRVDFAKVDVFLERNRLYTNNKMQRKLGCKDFEALDTMFFFWGFCRSSDWKNSDDRMLWVYTNTKLFEI